MAAEQATALVIRGSDWSETSRIVTLFTREHGKLRALAKGGRRLNSSFETAFDLLNCCQVMVIRKASGLDLLTEAHVIERFPQLRKSLPALYGGYYLAELLCDGTADHDPHPTLYDLSLQCLRRLDALDENPLLVLSLFELVWLQELGYSPRLDACAICGGAVNAPYALSPIAGGLVCGACQPPIRDLWAISPSGLEVLRGLAAGEGILPRESQREVRRLLGHVVSSLLGKRPRLLSYLDGQ